MRTIAALTVLTLAASIAMGAGAPAASGDPALDQNRIAAAAPAVPVRVVNSVTIDNLPLADDGSLRVSSGPAKAAMMLELVPTPINISGTSVDLPTIIDTTGYSTIGFMLQTSDGNTLIAHALWRWSNDEPFKEVLDQRGGTQGIELCRVQGIESRVLCASAGGSLMVRLLPFQGGPVTVTSVRVYLFP